MVPAVGIRKTQTEPPYFFFFFFSLKWNQGIELVTRTGSFQRIRDRNLLYKVEHRDGFEGVVSSDSKPQVLELFFLQLKSWVTRKKKNWCGFGEVGRQTTLLL